MPILRPLVRWLALVSATALLAPLLACTPDADYFLRRGRHFHEDQQYGLAYAECKKAADLSISQGEPCAACFVCHARAAEKLSELDTAESAYRRAVAIDPDHHDAWFGLGRILLRKQPPDLEGALAAFTQAARGRNADAHIQRGRILLALERDDEAVSAFEHASIVDPGLAEAYSSLGVAYLKTGRHAQAETNFKRAIELKPGNPIVMFSLGVLYLDTQRYAEAEGILTSCAKLQPDDAETWFHLALAAGAQGKRDIALNALRQAQARGFQDGERFRDMRFDSIRTDAEFKALSQAMGAPATP